MVFEFILIDLDASLSTTCVKLLPVSPSYDSSTPQAVDFLAPVADITNYLAIKCRHGRREGIQSRGGGNSHWQTPFPLLVQERPNSSEEQSM